MTTLAKRFRDLRYRMFYGLFLNRNVPLACLGNLSTGCAWNLSLEGLNAQSVVYSGGVGRDITFEHALVQRFGCSIVLFDPSPTGLETMSKPENQDKHFTFCPVALAGQCGTLKLAPPQNEAEGSWFAHDDSATLEVRAVDLATLMKENGHRHIDLLKLDIEGAEYGVLDHILERRIPVRQVLVEFHHGMLPGIRRSQSVWAILKMRAAGYRLVDQGGNNHGFLLPAGFFQKRLPSPASGNP
jgi:FkbM family methyltransferase